MITYLEKLRNRWQVGSLLQVVTILIVFSLTGSSIVLIRPLVFDWVGVTSETSGLTRWLWYILFIIPAYQVLLVGYGWLFGQSQFFLRRYRKILPPRFTQNNS